MKFGFENKSNLPKKCPKNGWCRKIKLVSPGLGKD